MLTIRTTISLPVHIHKKLRKDALEEGKSLNELLLQKILEKETVNLQESFKRVKKLTKGVKIKASEYKEFVNYGRKD